MSVNIEIEKDSDVNVLTNNLLSVDSNNNILDVSILEDDYNITVQKKEYTITSDKIYIPTTYEESPQWLKDIINNITTFSLNQKLADIDLLKASLTGLISELNIAKNAYTNSIISSAEIDSRINARIETLNSSIGSSNANIVDMIMTKATPTEASAIALSIVDSSINGGAIGTIVGNLQTSISNSNFTLGNNIDLVSSEMTGSINGLATASNVLSTYVGIDPDTNIPNGVGLLADVALMQNQIDGVIVTITDTYDVITYTNTANGEVDPNSVELVVTAEPYASWIAADTSDPNNISTAERSKHIGDVYIKYVTDVTSGIRGYDSSYKFIKTNVDNTDLHHGTDADGFTWAKILDQLSAEVYATALNAYDLADKKRRVFTSTPVVPYDSGDLWIRVVNGSNQIWRCSLGSEIAYSIDNWQIASTDDTVVNTLKTGLGNGTVNVNLNSATINGTKSLTSYIAEEIDKEVVVYSGTNHATQTGMKLNDIYIEKTTATGSSNVVVDVVNTYKYNGTVWVQISNNNNLTKLADLTDGKRTIYSGSDLPAGSVSNPLRVNDLFIPTSTFVENTVTYTENEMYRYNGTIWKKSTRYDDIKSSLESQILDNKIETFYQSTPPTTSMTSSNTGDYWYCTDNYIGNGTAKNPQYHKGLIYKYNHADTSWTFSADISKGAFDLADGKRTIFGNAHNDVPVALTNDIWIPSSTGGAYSSDKVYKFNGTVWVEVDYTNDEVVNGIIDGSTPLDPSVITIGDTSTTFMDYIKSEIDKKVAIYSGENPPVAGLPVGVAINDIYLWFTTTPSKTLANGTTQVYDITRTYRYSGSAWSEITTDSNITALADLADGKRTVFSDSVVPAGAVARDIWIPSADVAITTSAMCTVAGGTWTTVCSIPKYLQGEIYQYSDTNKWITATRYSTLISNLASTVQSQVDSKIETHYQSTVPDPLTSANDGDYWYCTDDVIGNGTDTNPQYKKRKVYKYTHVGALWTLTADVGGDAFDKADGKASIFTTSAKPNVYKKNDMLIVIADNDVGTYKAGVVLTASVDRTSGSFTASEWTKKINDTEKLDAFVDVINPKIATLQNQVDGKIEYFFYEKYNEAGTIIASATNELNALGIIDNQWVVNNDPVATKKLQEAATGNVVYFKNTTNGYWYSGSTNSWLPITDTSMMDALAIAEKAKSTADGKVTIYSALYSATRPTGTDGKFWYNESTAKLEYYTTLWTILSTTTIPNTTIPKLSDGDLVYIYGASGTSIAKNTGYRYSIINNIGSWVSIVDGGIKATADSVTELKTLLTDPVNGAIVTATNAVKQDLVQTILPNGLATVESKWAFNSAIKLGTTTYESGFGIVSNVAGNTGDKTPRPTSGSEFWIRADKLKMIAANQTAASKAPFTVNAETGVIDFNGVVSFANVKNDAAKTALIKSISDAQDDANSALDKISDIASDNKLTPVEKSSAQKEWDTIASEYTKNIAQAAAFGVSTTSYATAYNALNTYLNTVITTGVPVLLKDNMTTVSDIVGSTFRNKFKAYYDAKADLLNAISSGSRTENAITTIPNPIGGTYVGAATTTGIFVVKLPQLFTNTMMTLEIDVYNYAMNKSFTLKIAGYNSTSGWVNTSSNLIGSSSLEIPVRFAQNSTKCCIMIGDISSVWSHPKIKVKNCVFSHSNYEIDKWDNGWSISVATSLTGYTVTKTHTTGWQQEVQAALNDNTTVINGSNITTGTISADRINTIGLIAENISANIIDSKTITGSIIKGAYIDGAVINASYLDLDGELQVLTNYHISLSSYVKSSMPYAILVNNEYRLASISNIEIPSSVYKSTSAVTATPNGWNLKAGAILCNIPLYPYNSYSVSSSNKCVKVRPNALTFESTLDIPFNSNYTSVYYSEYGSSSTLKIYFGDVLLFTIIFTRISVDACGGTAGYYKCYKISINGTSPTPQSCMGSNTNYDYNVSVSNNGFICSAKYTSFVGPYGGGGSGSITISRSYLSAFTQDILGTSNGIRAVVTDGVWPSTSTGVSTITPHIKLNNMI